MGTRCNIHFTDGRSRAVQANIYRHSDGYPEGVLPDLEKFFSAVEEQTSGPGMTSGRARPLNVLACTPGCAVTTATRRTATRSALTILVS